MHPSGSSPFLDFLRRTMPAPGPDVVSDGELLARFAALRDEEAFRLLIRRHGPMVFGVARRVLQNGHAAEDVFQATFLALVRQAKSLRRQPAVAAWLYRVAVRISRKALPRSLPAIEAGTAPAASQLAEQNELRAALDAAVERLPEKLRRTVVLCYFSGHTTEQAARQLGCPKGTVLSRLSAAREKLQKDLTRRGITVSVAAVTATLAEEAAPAALPSALVAVTVKLAAPSAVIAPAILLLSKGAIAMSWMKVSLATMIVLGTGAGLGYGLAGTAQTAKRGQKTEDKEQSKAVLTDKELIANALARLNPKPGDQIPETERLYFYRPESLGSEEVVLKLMRAETANRECVLRLQEYNVGKGTLNDLLDALRRRLESQLDLSPPANEKIKILEQNCKLADQLYSLQDGRFQKGTIKQQDWERVRFMQIGAHLHLMKAQGNH